MVKAGNNSGSPDPAAPSRWSIAPAIPPSASVCNALLTALLLASGSLAFGQAPGSPVMPAEPGVQQPAPSFLAIDANAADVVPAKNVLPQDSRRMQYVADTTRLLKLARELKTEVDRSGKGVLSVGVIRKAQELEKLSKSLKERMRRP